jgi:hypothetical protein
MMHDGMDMRPRRAPGLFAWRSAKLRPGTVLYGFIFLLWSSPNNFRPKKHDYLPCTCKPLCIQKWRLCPKASHSATMTGNANTILKPHTPRSKRRPYMDVLRRRIPLFHITSGSWRAFTTEDDNGCSTPGGSGAALRAACYITRALRQTALAVVGATRHISESYDDQGELNRVALRFMLTFGPRSVDGVNVES